uniref:non-specific serine/threonine protein kinase n=1 Tax=Pyramimonas obovata TaxID=1411642 RepID=A0A7S0WVQ8_9CHLO|mmetsp:Transcript_6526/g.13245  ORF Transcript_6526/g.13245 Transcript_6526/m.13245 type:complete len:536 (-) Transcript_6526:222-1829(-)
MGSHPTAEPVAVPTTPPRIKIRSSSNSNGDDKDESEMSVSPARPDAQPGVCVQVSPCGRWCRYDKKGVAKGSFKEVYKGFDTKLGIEVAWNIVNTEHAKVLFDKKQIERLEREFQIMRALDNPHVVKCYGGWRTDTGQINFVTELFTSGNLRSFRNKHTDINLNIAINKWGREILSGIQYLHSQTPPIIHRDLRCEYVFINGNTGEVKIADLGRANFRVGKNTQNNDGGTLSEVHENRYYAPEMYDGDYDESVDIYAFGLILLELATLRKPYDECTTQADIYRAVQEMGKLPEAVEAVKDRELKAVIRACLQHDASQRPTASELLELPYFQQLDPKDIIRVEGSLHNQQSNVIDLKMHIPVKGSQFENRTVKFEFDMETDTSKSLAAEMMVELELSSYEAAVVGQKISDVVAEVTQQENPDDLCNTMKLVRIPDLEETHNNEADDPMVNVTVDPNNPQNMHIEFFSAKEHRELFFNIIHALHLFPLIVQNAVYSSEMGVVIDDFRVSVWEGHKVDPQELRTALRNVHADCQWGTS